MKTTPFRILQLLIAIILFVSIYIMMRFQASFDSEKSYLEIFSYFTIQSNFMAAVFLIGWRSLLTSQKVRNNYRYELVRGGLTLYMSITVIIYWSLLHHLVSIPLGLEYVANVILHSLAWIILISDFWIYPPQYRMNWQIVLYWLLYPVLYTLVTMFRGSKTGWYPYPFMDPARTGSELKTALVFLVMGSAFFAFGIVVIKLHNRWLKETE